MASDSPKTATTQPETLGPPKPDSAFRSLHWAVSAYTFITVIAAALVALYGTDAFTQLTMLSGIVLCFLTWRYIRDSLVVTMLTTLVLGAVLGWGLNFYDRIWWYDDFAHFTFSIIGVMALARLVLHKFQADSTWLLLTALWLSWLGIGSIWELGEWISDQIQYTNHSRGYLDTMMDMILNSAGSAIGVWMYWTWFRVKPAFAPATD